MCRIRTVVVAFAFVLGVSAPSAFAQDASITGTITDDTKAVLPGATVTATNLATGGSRSGAAARCSRDSSCSSGRTLPSRSR